MIHNTLKPYIAVGTETRKTFEETVDDFYNDFDSHLYIRGQAGVGKTWYVTNSKPKNIELCHIEGNISRWLFVKKIATFLHMCGWPANTKDILDMSAEDRAELSFVKKLPNVVIYVDDCATMFEKEFCDTMKIMLEREISDKMVYNISLGGQYKQSESFERDAMDNFKVDYVPGFTVPFYGKVKFIFTMNRALSSDIDIAEYKRTQGKKASLKILNEMEDKYAIFSRLEYKDLYMKKEEYWGWIADLVLNNDLLKGATKQDKEEMLMWTYDNWDNLREKSVRMVKQKLWKDLEKSKTRPTHDYKSRWYSLVDNNSRVA